MKARLALFAQSSLRTAIIPLAAVSLWSCTTAGTDMQAGLPSYTDNNVQTATGNPVPTSPQDGEQVAENAEGDQQVPLPSANPALAMSEAPPAGDQPLAVQATAVAETRAASTLDEQAAALAPADAAIKPEPQERVADAQPAAEAAKPVGDGSIATAVATPPPPPKKTGLFAFFGSRPRKTEAAFANRDGGGSPPATATSRKPATASTTGQVVTAAAAPAAELNMASLELPGQSAPARRSGASEDDGLPGVRKSALFDIKRRSGMDDDSDVDLYEDVAPVQLASAGGMARAAKHGLMVQHESVDVSCLKPALVRVLKQIEGRFGRKLVVTSGYRSPTHNRRARGAKNSQHMYCAAADVQIPGVSKWELAKYIRSMPNRGGVGTYCHTESIHIDIGPERDWNWRCRGKRKG